MATIDTLFSRLLLTLACFLLSILSACDSAQQRDDGRPTAVRSVAEARQHLKAVERENARELSAAKQSGDKQALERAKIRATERLAEAERELDRSLVEETNKLRETSVQRKVKDSE